jgi:hypothetical protein
MGASGQLHTLATLNLEKEAPVATAFSNLLDTEFSNSYDWIRYLIIWKTTGRIFDGI